jgi:LPXTG-motif cell wall-anchored protein
MKRLFAAAALAVMLLPFTASVARAGHKHPKDPPTPATEMATLGLASAVLIGGAGYLILRRRTRKTT